METRLEEEFHSYPVYLSSNDMRYYYYGFCNRTIWPLFHYFSNYTEYSQQMWDTYVKVNHDFLKATMKVVEPDDFIWVHDYHLFLLPGLLRKELPNARIGYFLHIPFPSFEIFRLMPWRNEILKGLVGADLIGFL